VDKFEIKMCGERLMALGWILTSLGSIFLPANLTHTVSPLSAQHLYLLS
jgi:hypothetical protein